MSGTTAGQVAGRADGQADGHATGDSTRQLADRLPLRKRAFRIEPQTVAELNRHFAIQDHLTFHAAANGLVEMRVVTPAAEATLYTYGAHLTRWNVAGEQPGIYLSPKSPLEAGKPIRGGIPVLYPWFATGWDGQHAPMHGFARTTVWNVDSTHLAPDGTIHITMALPPTGDLKKAGFGDCQTAIQFRIGRTLEISLEVTNHGQAGVVLEEGLHTYFAVGDIHQVATEGLEGTTYVDKRDNFVRKVQREKLLRYTRDVDQVHVHTTAPLIIHDDAWKREIHIHKSGSNTTVTWNPWSIMTGTIPDLADDSWQHFVCVETVNAGDDRITLAPGETHRMDSAVSIVRKG